MPRHVWWSPPARRAIEALTPDQRERFDAIAAFIAVSPFPVEGTTIITPTRNYGRPGYRYFNNAFPYMIYYRITDDEDVEIDLVLRAFVS